MYLIIPKRRKSKTCIVLLLILATIKLQVMSSRQRLKPVTPLKSALPDVFLRKNKFEERMLENKRKFLENAEKKVIERLAREQEEFAILNCVSIGADTVERTSETFANRSETFRSSSRSRSKSIEYPSDNFTYTSGNTQQSSVGEKLINEGIFSSRDSCCAVSKIKKATTSKRNNFRRSKSDTLLTYAPNTTDTELEKTREIKNTEQSSEKVIYEKQTKGEYVVLKPSLRPTLSLPAQNELKKAENVLEGRKKRVKSAPAHHTHVTFSGRDGRPMSFTPVIKQFGHVSMNGSNAYSRPNTAVKTLRDLPKMAQVQLKNNVYFLSQHKIEQQNEMTKIRTRRAMSAKTSKY